MTDDEYFNSEEFRQMELQEKLNERRRQRELDQQLDAIEAGQEDQKFIVETLQEALAEHNLTYPQYLEILKKDKNIFRETVKQGTRELVGKVSRMRDPKTGRFVAQGKQPQQAPQGQQNLTHDQVKTQAQYGQPQKGLPDMAGPAPVRVTGEKTQALKAKVERGHVPDDDELIDMLDDLGPL
jgi:hypothetical protein